MSKFIGYFAKIHDTLRSGKTSATPLYLSTVKNYYFEGKECLPYLSTPTGGGMSINPKESKCSVSSLKLNIVNVNYLITQWLYERFNSEDTMLYGEMIDVYAVTSENGFKHIYRGQLRGVSNDWAESYIDIEVADFQDRLKASIFDREFSEYQYETIEDINIYRLPYKIKDGKRFGFEISMVDTGDKDSEDKPILEKVITFTGHVIDFVEMIFQLTFSTPTLEVQMGYLDNKWENYVDLDSLDRVRKTLTANVYNFYFEFREPLEDPFAFLIENIYQPCSVFPYLTETAKLGVKLHVQPEIGSEGLDITEENIIKIESNTLTEQNVINNMVVKYDWDFKEDKSKTKRYFGSVGSFHKFKKLLPDKPQEYQILGINKSSDTDKATFSANLSDNMFGRYGLPNKEIEITLPLVVTQNFMIGGYVILGHKTLVSWDDGLPGLSDTRNNLRYSELTDDVYDGIAHLDVEHDWGGFVQGNTLGKSIDGNWVIDTTSREIVSKTFNSLEEGFKSCIKNHKETEAWILREMS